MQLKPTIRSTLIVSFSELSTSLFRRPKLLANSNDMLRARYQCSSCAIVVNVRQTQFFLYGVDDETAKLAARGHHKLAMA
jgi:hypothetical protein